MAKPYAHLRAQMSPEAQRQAEDKASAMLAADDTPTPAERAYATWVSLTPQRGDVRRPWPDLEPETRALWEAIAEAVLHTQDTHEIFLLTRAVRQNIVNARSKTL